MVWPGRDAKNEGLGGGIREGRKVTTDRDTIFALSSGRPPAAIAVIRVSGPSAGSALERLIGRLPTPRRASLARLRDPASGEIIDEGLALWFPAPKSETGEDMAELQVHGGRAVIAAVLAALGKLPGLRPARSVARRFSTCGACSASGPRAGAYG